MTLAFSLLNVLAASHFEDGTGHNADPVAKATETARRREAEQLERTFVSQVQSGDADAFRKLMELHFARAASFAYTFVHERDIAEDIAQDVFTRIWTGHTEWRPNVSVRAYVLGAVRNRALDLLKHQRVEAKHAEGAYAFSEEIDAVGSSRLERIAELHRLHAAVAELPERRRIALSLRYEHELSHAEVGAALNVSAKAAKELIVRTLDALRARLAEGT